MPSDYGGSSHCESAIPSLQPSFYRPELDFLRFLAFLAVFIQHSLHQSAQAYIAHGVPQFAALWMAAVPISGAYGVDLFFVLSAYLITELLQREFASTGKVDIRSFYIRRVLRIWPLYFFFLGVCVLLSRFGIAGEHLKITYVLAFVFLAGNWICAFQGYPNSVAAPLWSVSLEEQFYLTWPVLLRILHVKRLMQVAICMIVLSSVSRLALLLLGVKHPGVWCNTFARLDPIGCGIILAACLKGRKPTLSILTCSLDTPPWH
jgi:peptidoglycan/LPS O-acetylase OafA/YrhL